MYQEWHARIVQQPTELDFSLTIIRRTEYGKAEILRADGIIETVSIGEAIKPTLRLDQSMLAPLLNALLEQGIRPKDEGKTAGLYEAQSAHLEDLRHLLKLDEEKTVFVSGKPFNPVCFHPHGECTYGNSKHDQHIKG